MRVSCEKGRGKIVGLLGYHNLGLRVISKKGQIVPFNITSKESLLGRVELRVNYSDPQ